jgi:hypothetical protein
MVKLALALVIVAPVVARAEVLDQTPELPSAIDRSPAAAATAVAVPHDGGVGWDGGVVYQMGSFPVGRQSNTALGTRLEGGIHVGHLSVLGEYTFYDLDPSHGDQIAAAPGWSGKAHRFGATLRYRIALGRPASVFDDHVRHTYGWLELGAGEQLLGSMAGQSRHDLAAGVGYQMSFRNARGDRQVGFFLALRATQAAAPRDPDMPTVAVPPLASACRGSCPSMSTAAGVDRSFLFTAGVVFGN